MYKEGSRCGSAVKWWKWENKWYREDPGLLHTPGNLFKKTMYKEEVSSIFRSLCTYLGLLNSVNLCRYVCILKTCAWRKFDSSLPDDPECRPVFVSLGN
jgi:hypothetical protein